MSRKTFLKKNYSMELMMQERNYEIFFGWRTIAVYQYGTNSIHENVIN